MTRSQLKDLNFIGWIFFLAIFTIVLNGTFHEKQERDFVYFYSVGRILNESAPGSLYDYKVQTRLFNEVLPRKTAKYGLSPYPPFVALFFRPLAYLPYWVACRI